MTAIRTGEERQAMDTRVQREDGMSRRRALAFGTAAAAVAAGLGLARPAGRVGAQIVRTGGGIAGGGQVKTEGTRTHFSVFASRFEGDGLAQPYVVGKFQWVDGKADVTLVSTQITEYGMIAGGSANDRILRGVAKLNGEDGHPFVVRMADEGTPGSGKDTIAVYVAAPGATDVEANATYKLDGHVIAGDIELLEIALPF
jgi:hypothetical protein